MWLRALLLSGACAACFSGALRAENNGPAVTVEECWSSWLSDQHLADGFNNKDGRTIIVAQGTGTVTADKNLFVGSTSQLARCRLQLLVEF
jgi:hypothetical protein